MILVDLQQVMIASIMKQMQNSGGKIEINMFKHMVLNSLRSYRSKFALKYGDLVICTDSGDSWRKTVYPYYKANRKKDREESSLDWESIFEGLREIRADLRTYFPYKVIEVQGAEADDIIGYYCHKHGTDLPGGEQIMIISGDHDFKQLHRYMNVEQYDPVRSKKIVENNPEDYLLEHIIKGDRGDGVPNVLSADNVLVVGIRQGTMTKSRLDTIKRAEKNNDWNDVLDDPNLKQARRNFKRNRQMIDLMYTPKNISDAITTSDEEQSGKGRDKIFNYLMNNRMKHLMEYINDF